MATRKRPEPSRKPQVREATKGGCINPGIAELVPEAQEDDFPDADRAFEKVFAADPEASYRRLSALAKEHIDRAGLQASGMYREIRDTAISRMARIAEHASALEREVRRIEYPQDCALRLAKAELFGEEGERYKDDFPRSVQWSQNWSPMDTDEQLAEVLRKVQLTAARAQEKFEAHRAAGHRRPPTPTHMVDLAKGIAVMMKTAGTNPSTAPTGPFVAILELVCALAWAQTGTVKCSANNLARLALLKKTTKKSD